MRDRPESEYLALLATRRAELKAELTRILGGRTRMVLEIGSGHGHFLAAYAAQHPNAFCLGIDIASERVRRGIRKRDRAQLSNLAFVHADVADFLTVLPQGVSLDAVFILFPDPWPKKRHHKNRVIQPAFLSALAARCTGGAGLYFRTDYIPYFEQAAAFVAEHVDWSVAPDASWPFEYTTVFQSRAPAYQSLVAFTLGKPLIFANPR